LLRPLHKIASVYSFAIEIAEQTGGFENDQ